MPFYKEFANQGLTADKCPIMAFSVAEDELRAMDDRKLVGHLACWNYYQSHRHAGEQEVRRRVQGVLQGQGPPRRRRPRDRRPDRSRLLRRLRLEDGRREGRAASTSTRSARPSTGMEFDAPGGKKKMDEKNQHTWKPVLIGSIRADGQFNIVWKTPGLVKPDSFSTYLHTPEEIMKLTGMKM